MVNSKRKLSNLEAFTDFAEESPAISVEAIHVGNHVLSQEERKEREYLEKIVEKSFYSAGKALKDLRDKKLYRDQYPTFEEYCRVRFGFQLLLSRQSVGWRATSSCPESQEFRILHRTKGKS
jgi:hypothetical protein